MTNQRSIYEKLSSYEVYHLSFIIYHLVIANRYFN